VKDDGTLGAGKVLLDVTKHFGQKGWPGLPDGLKVDTKGNLYATGPGGVWILASEGTPLGRLDTGEATANCGWGNDGSTLYITADMYLLRIRLTATGLVWRQVTRDICGALDEFG
jgi:gluconolactonase